mmetsp:Transcript_88854/g.206780  ORF Transcript_88854/g.206780 Transcript_88854/m.206780 type:complete len:82 (+) Transcript_88854:321-566(+)
MQVARQTMGENSPVCGRLSDSGSDFQGVSVAPTVGDIGACAQMWANVERASADAEIGGSRVVVLQRDDFMMVSSCAGLVVW